MNEEKNDVQLQDSIYLTLTYVCLYLSSPRGFELCIKYGQKAVSDNNFCQNAWLWVNLAAAYGQQAAYTKGHANYPVAYDKAGEDALKAIQQALSLNRTTSVTFKKLIQKEFPKPSEENDWEILKMIKCFEIFLN